MIPELERSLGEGNGKLLQYSCLENPMDRGAWQAIVIGVQKSQIHLEAKQQQQHTFVEFTLKSKVQGTPLVVQWKRFHAPKAGSPGSNLGQGTRSHMLQLTVHMPAIKTWHSQINK